MKKIILLLCTFVLLSCGKGEINNENKITYDAAKGYLTNLESVKYGIVGVWKKNVIDNCFAQWTFNNNGTAVSYVSSDCSGDNAGDTKSYTYSVFEQNKKFYLKLNIINEPEYIDEILILTKTDFSFFSHTLIYKRQQ
jgi:hypothetical protein